MQLRLYKTLWGHEGSFETACMQAKRAGFEGIEGPVPVDAGERHAARKLLDDYGLDFIAEICTAGSYVPERHASLSDHLQSLEQQMQVAGELMPRFITCLGGCDAWPEQQSGEFFERGISMASHYGHDISFETHRGRSLFNPWVTRRLCEQIPELRLTCDFSHWCVVCERLLVGEEEVLDVVLPRAFHIHARVGYDQGPQVPDPSAPRYMQAVERHFDWWQRIWDRQRQCGAAAVTMTPEFGPDGYQAIDVGSDQPVGDLWEINQWMAGSARKRFARFSASQQETI